MSNAIFDEAMRIIGDSRKKAERISDERKAEVEEKITGLKELNNKLSSTVCELTKVIISKSDDAESQIEKIKRTNIETQNMRNELLTSNGYPADYLIPQYSCKKCSDTGFVDGKRCDCLEKLVEKLKIDKLNENSSISMYSFADFKTSYYEGKAAETMTKILGFCQRYAANFSKKSESLFMCGETGLGKTHLSLSIAKEVIARGYNVAYDSIINYLNAIEREHFGKSDNDTLSAITSVDLLILDDLGAEFNSPFYNSTVYNIINTRINKRLPTIISSNLTSDAVAERYDDRIASRIFGEYTYLRFVGDDVRQIKKIKKS
ncbi:MAG: ATP-binding protein [Oscillospiraceae bacterium]